MNFETARVKEFALDVWQDLRDTGMAGIAVGMALAFVAISAIVLRPAGPPEINTGYAAATAAPTEQVALALPEDKPLRISDIDMSAPRDPFESLDDLDGGGTAPGGSPDLVSVDETVDTSTATSSSSGGGSSSGGSSTSTTTTTTTSLVPIGDLDDDKPATRVTEPSEPHGEIEPESPEGAPATDFSYAVDVQFGLVGSLTRYKAVQRLGFVPSSKNPLLMYLGVKADHETAVFMVDSRLSQGGEGACIPKPSQCTFLEVSADPEADEHRFRDVDGNEYLLRMRGVVRTTASAGSVGGRDLAEIPGSPEVVDGSR